ncbi:putative E3 ubiquitin-protein ligase ARI4 [Zalerion maritima]|uniref:RBR-type E3 ubiquitin transferase n=1 Tax=Zalerion maritima TaxID=339359 RepID=A0AAD5RLB0_9PEZI|nr:putative E3 ubiquitin-protein ligase ARI4 [Zalerion maritima]
MEAYVEEYGGGELNGRRRRKSSRRTAAPAPAPLPSPPYDDWRSSYEKPQHPSPYRFTKPDIQSAESRTSSKEWSPTDSSLRAATSTMPSSLHTSRSSRRGAPAPAQYRRGKGGHPPVRKEPDYDYDDDDNDDLEYEYDYVEAQRPALSRRGGGSRRGPSPRPPIRRSRSAHQAPSHHQRSYSNSRGRSSRRQISDSEDSEDYDDDEDDRYDDETDKSLSASSDENEESYEEDGGLTREAKMPTIPEHDTRDRCRDKGINRRRDRGMGKGMERGVERDVEQEGERTKDRFRSRPSPRHQPPPNHDGYREDDDMVVVEEQTPVHAAPPVPQPPIPEERDAPEAELHPSPQPPLAEPPHPSEPTEPASHSHNQEAIRDVAQEEPPHEDYQRSPHRRTRKSRSKYTDEERDIRHRHSRRKSYHTDPEDAEDLPRYRNTRYLADGVEDRDYYRRGDRDRDRPHRRSTKARPVALTGLVAAGQVWMMPDLLSLEFDGISLKAQSMPPLQGGRMHQGRKWPLHTVAECLICMEALHSREMARLKCDHQMCFPCLQRNFELSLTDPQHMPPKCCDDPIPLTLVDHLFDNKFKMRWNRKLTEFSLKNPTYCPNKRCNSLILPKHIEPRRKGYQSKMAVCPKCHTEACTTCKGKWHKSKRCPRDPEANKLLDRARQEGWPMQKCYKCNTVVELKEGCNHMTCHCGAEFCMLCGDKWKRCGCPWFNYDDDDDGGLDYLNIERPARNGNPFAPAQPQHSHQLGGNFLDRRPAPPIGNAPEQLRPMSSHRLGSSHRAVPQPDFEERRPRRRRHGAENDHRRPNMAELYDDEYDLVDDNMLDIIGIGNTAGHFMNDDYRMMPVPMNAPPVSAHPLSMPRAATTGTAAIVAEHPRHKIRRQPSMMERRLADRFGDGRPSPTRDSGPQTTPPAPVSHVAPPLAHMGPTSALGTTRAPPMAPGHPGPAPPGRHPRRRAIEEEIYDETPTRRPRARGGPDRVSRGYIEEPGDKPRRKSEPPRSSTLAGLTGDGRGMNRVFEWRTHVFPGYPDENSAVTVA